MLSQRELFLAVGDQRDHTAGFVRTVFGMFVDVHQNGTELLAAPASGSKRCVTKQTCARRLQSAIM